jgi:hypothetical protein
MVELLTLQGKCLPKRLKKCSLVRALPERGKSGHALLSTVFGSESGESRNYSSFSSVFPLTIGESA